MPSISASVLRVTITFLAFATLITANAQEIRQEDIDGSLIAAAGRGDMNTFNTALQLGANIKATDRHGDNAVLTATQGNHTQLLALLLDKGVSPNAKGSSGFTPLTYAAMYGSVGNIRLLLKAGADPNLRNALGDAPLHLAAQFGHPDVIAILAAASARIDAPNAAGDTPLIVAIRANQSEAFNQLIKLGASTNAADHNKFSALILAIREDRETMALALAENGARAHCLPRQYTPLQMARFMGHASVASALEKRDECE